ncbi:MAG: hypothetical protein K9K79_04565 [Desulfohalobiaceae bacterium]|nr:hypothetical protein [Desulfohalobiaceae bacterium]
MVKAADSSPLLLRAHKGRFPFTLACPSFIYPADYLPNVRRLGPYLDEIELLFLEGSSSGSLPDRLLIRELAVLAGSFGLTYNVHLPTDISLTAEKIVRREQAAAAITRVFDLVQPLEPSACVLHLPWQGKTGKRVVSGQRSVVRGGKREVSGQWSVVRGKEAEEVGGGKTEVSGQRSVVSGREAEEVGGERSEDAVGSDPCPLAEARGKQEFLDLGVQGLDLLKGKGADQERLVLENLETYPLKWVEEILDETGLGLCLDLGHLLLQGADLWEAFERNRSRIRIMHLHGFELRNGVLRDHCGLHRLAERHLHAIKHILKAFQGVVCLEVFNFQDLSASLAVLEELLV